MELSEHLRRAAAARWAKVKSKRKRSQIMKRVRRGSNDTERHAVRTAKRNAGLWADYVLRKYLPYLETVSDIILESLTSTLSDKKIKQKADEVQSETERAYPWSEDTDASDVAEDAFNQGLEYYMTAHDVRWAVFATMATALYHLVEQQVCELCRLAFFGPRGEPVPVEETIRLLKKVGVDVARFSSWRRINELRHLANCVKHAEGTSCDQLRKLRPRLFQRPTVGPRFRMLGIRTHVRNPLMGEDVYVTQKHLAAYLDGVRRFWRELAGGLKGIES